jgi:hypothetical protein
MREIEKISRYCIVLVLLLVVVCLPFSSINAMSIVHKHNVSHVCFQESGIYLRRHPGLENWGPGGWIESLISSITVEINETLHSSTKDFEPLTETLIDQIVDGKCKFKGVIYQVSDEYFEDYLITKGRISVLQNKTFFGPFGVSDVRKSPEKFHHTHFLIDNPGVYNYCNSFSEIVNCYLQPQCASLTVIQHAKTIPPESRITPILYLKAHSGLTWNETVIEAIKETTKNYGFPDFQIFIYGFYKQTDFFQALVNASFAVVFSPWETMGLYHIEIRQNKVPVFSLSSRGVNAFKPGLSGEIAEAGSVVGHPKEWHKPFNITNYPGVKPVSGVPLNEIIEKYKKFLQKLNTYHPLSDLRKQNLLPPGCTQLIRDLFGDTKK